MIPITCVLLGLSSQSDPNRLAFRTAVNQKMDTIPLGFSSYLDTSAVGFIILFDNVSTLQTHHAFKYFLKYYKIDIRGIVLHPPASYSILSVCFLALSIPNRVEFIPSCKSYCWHFFYQLSTSVKCQSPVYIYIWLSRNEAHRHMAAQMTAWGNGGQSFTMKQRQYTRSHMAIAMSLSDAARSPQRTQRKTFEDSQRVAEMPWSQMHMHRQMYICRNLPGRLECRF